MTALLQDYLPLVIFLGVALVIGLALGCSAQSYQEGTPAGICCDGCDMSESNSVVWKARAPVAADARGRL